MGCGHSQLRRDGQQRTSRRASQHVWDGVVKPAPEWKVEPALTTEQIERLRNEFWETRVEGRAEMWQALQAAAQADSVCNNIIVVSNRRRKIRKHIKTWRLRNDETIGDALITPL